MLVIAPFVGLGLTPLALAAALPALFLTAFATSALGLLIAARMRSPESYQVTMGFVVGPMLLLSGAIFPLGNLPGWLAALTLINPFSYAVDAIREIILSGAGVPPEVLRHLGISLFGHRLSPLLDLAVVAAFAVLTIALAARAFNAEE